MLGKRGLSQMQAVLEMFQEINSFGWYNDTVKNSSITTKHLYLILTFPSHDEIFIRRSWYSVLLTSMTAFLMRQLIVASRLGRTEYQLLLMKIS